LGSSAAALVAALGLRRARRGDDLGDPAVRDELFRAAFDAHRQAQGGGSGVDIAASVFGGTRIYRRVAVPAADREKPPSLRIPPVALPPGVVVDVWFSGTSARTASLRALVDTFAADAPREFALCMERLVSASHDAVSACERFDSDAFVEAVRSAEEGLRALGAGARAPIVTEPFAVLGAAARGADGAFVPSGAGGGDVGLWVGRAPPPAAFCARARSLGFSSLGLGEAKEGVRIYTPDDDGFPAHGRDAER
jgi:phosphomevalonate kinase